MGGGATDSLSDTVKAFQLRKRVRSIYYGIMYPLNRVVFV